MSYFRYIDNGVGPVKLFVGGVHGREGRTSIRLLKKLGVSDFSCGQIFIYNFDDSEYISTLKSEFYESEQGKEILSLINYYKPDFYTELHAYNIKNYKKLIGEDRRESQGVPPLINCNNHVLCSSVSPLIRQKYFTKKTICKTLEIPCFGDNRFDLKEAESVYSFNKELAIGEYMNFLKLITNSLNRKDFEDRILMEYPKQVDLAKKYVKEIFGEDFPPY